MEIQVTSDEVEEVFQGPLQVRRIADGRYMALVRTIEVRLAFAIFECRPGRAIRVITARDMDAKERRRYRRK